MIIEGVKKNEYLFKNKRIFLVCDSIFERLEVSQIINKYVITKFCDFKPNPTIDEVQNGVKLFNKNKYDLLVAVGGGSSIDVAKCIKYYSKENITFIAIPTTAGTGSESTKFAVVYKNDEKQSISSNDILPDYSILDESVLCTLPEYVRKTTMLDALCHSIESFWSKKATKESQELSVRAIKKIMKYKNMYLNNITKGNKEMLKAANIAGQAINITTTTAAHAMSYKLTSIYKISHGHACAICLPEVWKINKSIIPNITIDDFISLLDELKIWKPVSKKKHEDIQILVKSVNLERLSNNPVLLNKEQIKKMYERILQ